MPVACASILPPFFSILNYKKGFIHCDCITLYFVQMQTQSLKYVTVFSYMITCQMIPRYIFYCISSF